MTRLMGLLLLAALSPTLAQEPPPAAAADSLAPAAPRSDQAASPFYHPPVIRELWERYYTLVDGMDAEALTKRFVQGLLDSLARSIQADFDSMTIRARAFESRERGYTHRYYRSPLTRDHILGEPISEELADDMPHFHAVYDPQGYLLRVRYVEPRRWRARQELLAGRSFQADPSTPPLVRYFQAWDVRQLGPLQYTRKKKIEEGEPFIRVLYDLEDNLMSLQSYERLGALVYTLTYGRATTDSTLYARLEFAADSTGSLLDVHPYVYLRDWSLVNPGWKVALTRDKAGQLASTQVFNELDQLSYYYTFSMSDDPAKRTRTLRGTVLSDAHETRQVFALVYDRKDHMVRRSFFTEEGLLVETTNYDYDRRSSELVITTRNAVGKVTAQQRFIDPYFWN